MTRRIALMITLAAPCACAASHAEAGAQAPTATPPADCADPGVPAAAQSTAPATGESSGAPEQPQASTVGAEREQLVVRADAVAYRPCPPTLPAGCEIAVLEGSPKAPGLFTIRIRTSTPFVMPPHTHPRDERVTVLAGTIGVGFGTAADKSRGQTFGPGDYYVNPPNVTHYVWADEPVSIQITGIGPWEIHPHKQ